MCRPTTQGRTLPWGIRRAQTIVLITGCQSGWTYRVSLRLVVPNTSRRFQRPLGHTVVSLNGHGSHCCRDFFCRCDFEENGSLFALFTSDMTAPGVTEPSGKKRQTKFDL